MKPRVQLLRGRRFRYSTVALLALLALGGADQVPANAGHPLGANRAEAEKSQQPPITIPVGPPGGLPLTPDAQANSVLLSYPSWSGIPTTVFSAYSRAADSVQHGDPSCRLSWPLLAAIGKVESNHAENGDVTPNGDMLRPILGPQLDGTDGMAAVLSAVTGAGDPQWAQAEGPMQFLPSTWAKWGADGNGDGKVDVQNVFDAALGAANYLCSGNVDLSNGAGLAEAILRYNPSPAYLDSVTYWLRVYTQGATVTPDQPGGWSGILADSHVVDSPQPAAPPPPPPQQAQAAPAPSEQSSPPSQQQAPPSSQPPSAPPPQPWPTLTGQVLQPVTRVVNGVVTPVVAPVVAPVAPVVQSVTGQLLR